MTAISNIPISQTLAVIGVIGAMIAFMWRAGISIVDRVERSKQKQIDYAHKKSEQFENQKLQLQKELESEKQQHVHESIETIRTEMRGVSQKMDKLGVEFVRTEERSKSHAAIVSTSLNKIKCFIDATNKRFETVEKEVTMVKNEMRNG